MQSFWKMQENISILCLDNKQLDYSYRNESSETSLEMSCRGR